MSKRKVQKVVEVVGQDPSSDSTIPQDPIGEKGLKVLARMIAHRILANSSASSDESVDKSNDKECNTNINTLPTEDIKVCIETTKLA